MKRFEQQTALVTGAASGIGRATAERLAREGARVLACDIDEQRLRDEAGKLAAAGLDVTPHLLDVTNAADCAAAVAAAVARFGRLDVLCNIAGTLLVRNFAEITAAEWARVMAINVNGIFHLCQAALPHLLQSKGNIVNIASTAGLVGIPYGVAYSTSKSAVVGLTRALAAEFASAGVRVNAVAPGNVATPMTAVYQTPPGADMALLMRLTPLMKTDNPRITAAAQPEEIAAAVAFLASAESRFATGTVLAVDGGQTAV